MVQISRSVRLVKKAEAALVAAIEIYNKPDFRYREETFAILALNAWELLVKAKLLAENNNDPRSLYVYERHTKQDGTPSTKLYLRKNRAGNVHTLGLSAALTKLESDCGIRLSAAVKRNIDALTEIRDNAVHYVNASPRLAKQVLEVGTASVKNFVELLKRWFVRDLSRFSLFLMPLGFVGSADAGTALSLSVDEENLLDYLSSLVGRGNGKNGDTDFHVALEVNLSFKRSTADAAAAVAITTDPAAQKVVLSEEDIRKRYPWDYRELTRRLRRRYIDFKENNDYHAVRKPLMGDPRYVRSRFLDPGNPRSAKKDFYNSNILKEFDKHYTRK